jgi:large subunit ribosomal protein L4
MATVKIKNISGDDQGELELADAIFGAPVSENAVRQALNGYLANQRSGTAKTKTRSEVRGGAGKPWRQKGTGRARAGTIRSPLWRGGGTIFGPIPRSYRIKVNKKVRRQAIVSVLSSRAAEEAITVVESLDLSEIKTRQVVDILKNLDIDGRTLVVARDPGDNLLLSARNLPRIRVTVPENLNVYDLLGHEQLLFTRAAVELVSEIYSGEGAAREA